MQLSSNRPCITASLPAATSSDGWPLRGMVVRIPSVTSLARHLEIVWYFFDSRQASVASEYRKSSLAIVRLSEIDRLNSMGSAFASIQA